MSIRSFVKIFLSMTTLLFLIPASGLSDPTPTPPPSPLPPPTAPTSNSIPAPCSLDGQSQVGLQKCSLILGTQDPKQIVSSTTSYFNKTIECLYKGYSMSPAQSGATTSQDCTQARPLPVGTVVCSLADGEGDWIETKQGPAPLANTTSGSPDSLHNAAGASCGMPDTLTGTWEANQMLGLWVQALKFYRDQALNQEALTTGNLQVHPACQPMSNDYQARLLSLQTAVNTDLALGMAVPPGADTDPNICATSIYGPFNKFCQYEAARGYLYLMFTSLLKCEITWRSSFFFASTLYKYTNFLADPAVTTNNPFLKDAGRNETQVGPILIGINNSQIVDPSLAAADPISSHLPDLVAGCSSMATTLGYNWGHQQSSCGAGQDEGIGYFKDCYRTYIKQFFFHLIKGNAPGEGIAPLNQDGTIKRLPGPTILQVISKSETSFSGIFLVGSWRSVRKRKKVRQTRRRVFKRFFLFLVGNILVIFSVTQWRVGACDSCNSRPTIPNPVWTCLGYVVDQNDPKIPTQTMLDCCQSSPSWALMQDNVANDPVKCASCNPVLCSQNLDSFVIFHQADGGFSGVLSSIVALQSLAANTSNSSQILNGSGSPLVGKAGNTAAATAGGEAGGNGVIQNTPLATGLSAIAPLTSSAGRLGGSSGAASAGNNSGLSSDGSANNSAAGSGSVASKIEETSLSKMSSGGPGRFGGTSGARRATAGDLESGSAPSDLSFGRAETVSGDSMKLDDPQDYFTRTGLDQNIFKAIHDRYQSTTSQWIKSRIH